MRRKIAVMALAVGLLSLAVPRPGAAISRCATPREGWATAAPAAVRMDAQKLQEAMDWATLHATESLLVVRHGCLVGSSRLDPLTAEQSLNGWSMTKSVTSMLVGRAVTMRKFNIDKPLSTWIPEADRAHGKLTPRHLLTMSSGLHHNWVRDPPLLGTVMPDQVRDALSLPFDYKPGTHWEYAQTPVTLLLHALERALKMDIQDWAQRNLFGPIGIPAGSWSWGRDRAGHTEGWANLSMRPVDWARLGYLMLHKGIWNGKQLISAAYQKQATSRIRINHAYGLLFWINGADRYPLPNTEGPDEGRNGPWPGAPKDAYAMVGFRNQRIWMIPSLDMVIVRMGEPGEFELDTRNSVWQSQPGIIDHEIPRRVLQAVTDVKVSDPGPYQMSAPVVPPLDEGVIGDAQNVDDVVAALGFPGYGPAGCTPLGCS